MKWHIIQGEAGCAFAREHGCTAVVVDALRASATAAMLLHAGAREIYVVRGIEDAFEAKGAMPDALLYGERGGVPPAGFDYGNSPREAVHASGRRVIFTTTTGGQLLVGAYGAPAVFMGATLNASALVSAVSARGADTVLVPAGLHTDPAFSAQEDWVAATLISTVAGAQIDEGRDQFEYWRARIEREGVPALFASAPHAEKLRAVNLDADIEYCARIDLTDAVPVASEKTEHGVKVIRL